MLLITSSPFTGFAQDSPKPASSKATGNLATWQIKSADGKAESKASDSKLVDKKQNDVKTGEREESGTEKAHQSPLWLRTVIWKSRTLRRPRCQDKHENEIESLNQKLGVANAKHDAKVEAVLVPAQKKLLKEMGSANDEKEEEDEK